MDCVGDGAIRKGKVEYSSNKLSVFLDNSLILEKSLDLNTLLGLSDGKAWVGFTSTARKTQPLGGADEHDLLAWAFESNAPVATRIIRLEGDLAFGNVTVGQSASRTLTIHNDGNSTMTVSGISYPNGFSGNWAGGTISAGGSRNVTVTFSPQAAQGYSGTITVSSDKTSGTNTTGCSGTGTAVATRIIRLEGDLAFGNVTIGQSASRTLTIHNDGNSTMTVSGISYPNGFSGNWAGGTIGAGGVRNVTVIFSPYESFAYGGTITVGSDKTSGANISSCSGTGTPSTGSEYRSSDVPIAIQDEGTIISVLSIPGAGSISVLKVKVNISHTYDSDLDVYLIAPDGTRIELFTDVGETGNDFINTTLDDHAETSISDGTAPFAGTYRPEESLSVLVGRSLAGTWRLEITDDSPWDTGNLNDWSLIVDIKNGSAMPWIPLLLLEESEIFSSLDIKKKNFG